MSIMDIATKLLSEKLGSGANAEAIPGALQDLIGGSGDGLDLGGLISKLGGAGGLSSVVGSWLGNGANEGIDASKVMEIFGGGAVSDFASKVGVSTDEASSGLADALPQLVDKFSDGGSLMDGLGGDLLEKAGGAGGLLSAAKSLFGK